MSTTALPTAIPEAAARLKGDKPDKPEKAEKQATGLVLLVRLAAAGLASLGTMAATGYSASAFSTAGIAGALVFTLLLLIRPLLGVVAGSNPPALLSFVRGGVAAIAGLFAAGAGGLSLEAFTVGMLTALAVFGLLRAGRPMVRQLAAAAGDDPVADAPRRVTPRLLYLDYVRP